MKTSLSLFSSPATATRVTITTLAIAVVLISSNFTFINAQQSNSLLQQQPPQQLGNSLGQVQNGTVTTTSATTYQNANDSFRVQVPQGWTISDLNNTGLALSQESTRGYGILAQLCPEGEQGGLLQRRTAAPSNASGNNSTSNCQGAENNVVHIIRYPNLNISLFTNGSAMNSSNATTASTTPTIGNVLNYHLQKLQQVGYHDIKIVRNSAMRVNLTSATDSNQTLKTAPAWFAQIAYTTAMEPNRTNTGYFILTFTNGTAPDPATIKGYALFYDGDSTNRTSGGPGIAATSNSSTPLPQQPSPAVAQILRSFELIVTPEIAQTLAQQAATQAQSSPLTSTTDTNELETNTTDTSAAEATTGADEDTEDTGDDDNGADDDGGDDDNGADDDGGDDDNGADDDGGDDDNGADDDGGDDDGGDEGEGNASPNTPDEFADCIVQGLSRNAEDTGC